MGKLQRLEKAQENLDTDDLDGADIIGVLMTVALEGFDMDLLEFLDHPLAINLIDQSQSNPERSTAIIREWATLDDQIAELS